jgi:hypothetical protein
MVPSGMLRRVALVSATRRSIPEGTIAHSHSRENLKSYIRKNILRCGIKVLNVPSAAPVRRLCYSAFNSHPAVTSMCLPVLIPRVLRNV